MKGYEIIFITGPDLSDEDLSNILEKLKTIIPKYDGKLVHEFVWGRRRLAYQIRNNDYGVYHVWYITGSGTTIDELHRQFRYSDEVLRFQTIKVDDVDQEANYFSELSTSQEEPDDEEPDDKPEVEKEEEAVESEEAPTQEPVSQPEATESEVDEV